MVKTDKNFPQCRDGLLILVTWSKLSDSNETLQKRKETATFLIALILASIRSRNDIALAIASSEIAATLLDGGRTAHSALKLPLNLQTVESQICNITRNSGMGMVLRTFQLLPGSQGEWAKIFVLIGPAVSFGIGYKQTNRQTYKQTSDFYIYR